MSIFTCSNIRARFNQSFRYYIIHENKKILLEDQKIVMNFFGENCNFISVPLKEDEKKVQDELKKFTYQPTDYEDPIDYPVYYEEELRDPAHEATANVHRYLKSEIKNKLSKVRIWLKYDIVLPELDQKI